MDDLKPTDDSTKEPVSQTDTPQPTPPEPAPTTPPTTKPEKPPEAPPSTTPPQIVTTQMTTPETPGEKPKLSARFLKPPRKKIIAGIAVLLIVVLGGISVVTAWRLRQVEKVTPEEAEAVTCGGIKHFRVVGEVYCQDPGGSKIPISGVKIRRIIEDCNGPDDCIEDERVSRMQICPNWKVTYTTTTNDQGLWISDARIKSPSEISQMGRARTWQFKIAEMPATYKDANGIERDISRLTGPIAVNCEESHVCVPPEGFTNTTFCSSDKEFYRDCSFRPGAWGNAQGDGHKCYLFDSSDQECSTAESTGNENLDRLYSKNPCTDERLEDKLVNCWWPFLGTEASGVPPLNFKFTNCTPEALMCLDLTSEPDVTGLEEGDEVDFTCQGSVGVGQLIDHVQFRAQIDGGDWLDLGVASATKTNGEYEGAITYSVPQTGSYRIECRVCTSTDDSECTEWGKAE